MGGMEKTTVYLTSEQKAALARAARTEGRSEARLIRDGIDALIARHRTGETAGPLAAGEVHDRGDLAGRLAGRPRWMDRDDFVRRVLSRRADPGLRAELRETAPDTTDDVVHG